MIWKRVLPLRRLVVRSPSRSERARECGGIVPRDRRATRTVGSAEEGEGRCAREAGGKSTGRHVCSDLNPNVKKNGGGHCAFARGTFETGNAV